MAVTIGSVLLQILIALLCGRTLSRRGWRKSFGVLVGALPVPVLVVTVCAYLFVSAPVQTGTPIASRQATLRQDLEIGLVVAAIALYLVGVVVAWLAVRFIRTAKPHHLKDIFQ